MNRSAVIALNHPRWHKWMQSVQIWVYI